MLQTTYVSFYILTHGEGVQPDMTPSPTSPFEGSGRAHGLWTPVSDPRRPRGSDTQAQRTPRTLYVHSPDGTSTTRPRSLPLVGGTNGSLQGHSLGFRTVWGDRSPYTFEGPLGLNAGPGSRRLDLSSSPLGRTYRTGRGRGLAARSLSTLPTPCSRGFREQTGRRCESRVTPR